MGPGIIACQQFLPPHAYKGTHILAIELHSASLLRFPKGSLAKKLGHLGESECSQTDKLPP
jgi:hypothetical protein